MAGLVHSPARTGKRQSRERKALEDVTNKPPIEKASGEILSSTNTKKKDADGEVIEIISSGDEGLGGDGSPISAKKEYLANRSDFTAELKKRFQSLFAGFEEDVQRLYDEVDRVVMELATGLKQQQEEFFHEVESRFSDIEAATSKGNELSKSVGEMMTKLQRAFSVLHEEGFSGTRK